MLDKFIGKVCTILTNQTSFPFKDAKQYSEFFTGQVVEVNNQGICIKHLNTNTLAFYSFPIIGIVEEQVIAKNDPAYEEIKRKLEKPQAVLSVEEMTKMAKEVKK